MKIVVTGALGHIGSKLIRYIPQVFPEAEIVMIDDLSSQRYCSLFNLPPNGRYRFIEADVLTADFAAVFSGADCVVHLAAITNAAGTFEMGEQVERVNYMGTNRVANMCLESGCPMIFISTTSVYGSQEKVVDENCPLSDLIPQSPYADSKLKAEILLETLGKEKGLQFVTCRFGTIFGVSVGMRFHTAVNKFCWQAVMGQPITVWRTALNQYRPYLDLGDAMEVLGFIIRKDMYDMRVYNALTTNATVREIIDIISNYVPDLSIQYVDAAIMNQLSYHVSNDRLKNLGFEFHGNLAKGISETIQLFKGILS
jgi:nucleoside-diphosphate-sugar epimerase